MVEDSLRGSAPGGGAATPAAYPAPSAGVKAGVPAGGPASRQLIVGAARQQRADEVAQLTILAPDAGANASVVIAGLAPGSVLSAGKEVASNTWQLSVAELAGAAIAPPRGFVGTMDLSVELRLADTGVVDRKGLQLEWSGGSAIAPAEPAPRPYNAAEIAQMLRRGGELMANGDVAAARLMYQRAAEEGEAAAAFALAETYDPLVLAKGGIPPDIALAHKWYERARDLGSALAPARLERLARLPG
jgi:TPR repeat protein